MASPTLATRRRTSAETQVQVWNSRPGWGIAASLTPPELVKAYRLHRLRERIVLCICLVALFTTCGFAYGFYRSHLADGELSSAQSQTALLQHQAERYGAVTKIQGSIAQVRARLATLLAGDVDAATLIGRIRAAAPSGVAISALTVTVDGAAGAGQGSSGGGSGSGPATSLDTSGAMHIGSIEINGTGRQIDDVPNFVDALAAVPGVVDVLPTTNATQAIGTKFTLTLTLTDHLLTHRFDPSAKAGGK